MKDLALTLLVIVVSGALMVLLFLGIHGCSNPFQTVFSPDKTKGVNVSPTSVSYTDSKTHKTVKVKKPIEGGVVLDPGGKVTVQQIGLCLIPKVGYAYVAGDGFQFVVGARFLFADAWGLEGMGNAHRLFLGVDRRLPVLDLLTASLGASSEFTGLLSPTIYASLDATLSL